MRDATILAPMVEILTCLEQELTKREIPLPAVFQVQWGDQVPFDYCGENGCNGQAWVRLVDSFAMGVFPDADPGAVRCSDRQGWHLEVGIVRCAPKLRTVAGKPVLPSTQDTFEAAALQLADMDAMRAAVLCCFGDSTAADDIDFSLGLYSPASSLGGCVGGTWAITLG